MWIVLAAGIVAVCSAVAFAVYKFKHRAGYKEIDGIQ